MVLSEDIELHFPSSCCYGRAQKRPQYRFFFDALPQLAIVCIFLESQKSGRCFFLSEKVDSVIHPVFRFDAKLLRSETDDAAPLQLLFILTKDFEVGVLESDVLSRTTVHPPLLRAFQGF